MTSLVTIKVLKKSYLKKQNDKAKLFSYFIKRGFQYLAGQLPQMQKIIYISRFESFEVLD
jgi:hypothetical protein